MRVPIAWLRDYVDLPAGTDEIVDRLAALGFPVDEIVAGPALTHVVAGRIAKLERHPNADRLQLCTLEVGADAPLVIATAATNVAAQQLVPVARIGAELAGGLTIAPRKMRGVDSQGMLCSAGELGLPADWFEDGIMQLDPSLQPGDDVVAALRLGDAVLDVDVTPNRPDALSMLGLARELAASFGVPLREPDASVTYVDGADDARVTIETLDCRRFVFQRAGGLRVRPAAAWMRVRLALAGQRPINNVVDISNFVMLEVGQPMHFFDFDRIAGARLIVRDAHDGERFVTLDGQARELDARMIVIVDDDGPTSLAGIMGGLRSEVVAETTDVLIEAATWTGPRIRRTSIALKLRTEASGRFEKSLPLALADFGAARAAHLLEREGAAIRPPRSQGEALHDPAPVLMPIGEVERLLGFIVSDAEIERSLGALGFTVGVNAGVIAATPPFWRNDIALPADLVEEIARMVGYERVQAQVPPVAAHDVASDVFERETMLATELAGLGYTEAISLSLQPGAVAQTWHANGIATGQVVEIMNPLSEDQRYMRFSLAPALLEFAARDRAVRPYRVFELGHVFASSGSAQVASATSTPDEAVHLTALHASGEQSFGQLKSDVLALVRRATGVDARVERGMFASMHPGKTAALRIGETIVGFVGVVDPRLASIHDLADTTALATLFVERLPPYTVPAYTPPSKFPALDRDLAVVVPLDVLAGDLVAAVQSAPLVRAATAFDEYRGPQIGAGKKSLALRIVLQSGEETLTDVAADAAIARIVATLSERFGAALRSTAAESQPA